MPEISRFFGIIIRMFMETGGVHIEGTTSNREWALGYINPEAGSSFPHPFLRPSSRLRWPCWAILPSVVRTSRPGARASSRRHEDGVGHRGLENEIQHFRLVSDARFILRSHVCHGALALSHTGHYWNMGGHRLSPVGRY